MNISANKKNREIEWKKKWFEVHFTEKFLNVSDGVKHFVELSIGSYLKLISRKFLNLFYLYLFRIWFHKKIVKTSYRTDFKVESTNDYWNCVTVTQLAMNLISWKKILISSYGIDFKVDFTKNSWNFFTQLALNLILRKKSWSLVRDLFSKLISRKILETELYNMLL